MWDPERRASILIALRADFFGRLAAYPELADLVAPNHALVGPMTASELRRAIEGPCERAGLAVEAPLVDALVDDVAGELGGLPLLSTTLVDLWHDRDGRTLTFTSYERFGGVRGAVGRHAEAGFRSLDEDSRQLAKSILLRLVAGGKEGGAFTRRRVARAQIDVGDDERVGRVLATLVAQRLLVADDGTVELVHDALIEHWPRLSSWLEQNREGRRLHEHLTQAASDWAANDRDPGELYRGARLAATLAWLDGAAERPALNRLEDEFLEASRAAATLEAERQRRANRRLRNLLAAALALLLAAFAAGAVALRERGTARGQATAAIAQRLNAQALAEPRLDRALLLAREGVNLDDSLATRSNLLTTLLRSPAALAVLRGGGARVLDDALSPDGRILAARSDNGSVTFFDPRTLREHGPRFASTGLISYCGAIVRPVRALAFQHRRPHTRRRRQRRQALEALLRRHANPPDTRAGSLRERGHGGCRLRAGRPHLRDRRGGLLPLVAARAAPRDDRIETRDGRSGAAALATYRRRTPRRLYERWTLAPPHERRDEVAPARRADARADPDVSDLGCRGALARRRAGCLRGGRRQRCRHRRPHRRAATDGTPGDRPCTRGRVQP